MIHQPQRTRRCVPDQRRLTVGQDTQLATAIAISLGQPAPEAGASSAAPVPDLVSHALMVQLQPAANSADGADKLSVSRSPRVGVTAGQVKFVSKLQRTFALLLRSERGFIDPSDTLQARWWMRFGLTVGAGVVCCWRGRAGAGGDPIRNGRV